jgi:hypothetical protein
MSPQQIDCTQRYTFTTKFGHKQSPVWYTYGDERDTIEISNTKPRLPHISRPVALFERSLIYIVYKNSHVLLYFPSCVYSKTKRRSSEMIFTRTFTSHSTLKKSHVKICVFIYICVYYKRKQWRRDIYIFRALISMREQQQNDLVFSLSRKKSAKIFTTTTVPYIVIKCGCF